jgi:tetratricopeptide (TPR) repeat protein
MTGTYTDPAAIAEELEADILREKNPDEIARLYALRAGCLAALGRDQDSLRDYLKALESTSSAAERSHIEAMVSLAMFKRGDNQSALWWAMAAANHRPESAEAQHVLALNCYCAEFYSLAINFAQRALLLEPKLYQALRLLGQCYREDGDLEESIRILTDYINKCPNDPRGFYELAWSTQLLPGTKGGRQKASEFYRQALALNPSEWLRCRIAGKLSGIAEFDS